MIHLCRLALCICIAMRNRAIFFFFCGRLIAAGGGGGGGGVFFFFFFVWFGFKQTDYRRTNLYMYVILQRRTFLQHDLSPGPTSWPAAALGQ